jgi:hypothetical protein
MSKEEELPNEGKTITFLVRMEEVTDQILPHVKERMDRHARQAKVRALSSEIARKAAKGTAYHARVRSMFNDNRFFLFLTETYRDVRLVGAPPESIGKFGGDTDNWVWPRHTGDFSLYRVYTGPDGKPADYHPDNIPLKSKHYLPVSLAGYEKGDFAMILGYPGSTDRYLTSWEVEELLELTHPNRVKIRGLKLALQKEDMLASDRVRLQYAAKYSGASNYYKYSIGQSKGLKRLKVVERKRVQEAKFAQWIEEDSGRSQVYAGALDEIREVVEERHELVKAEQYLYEVVGRGQGMESAYFARNLQALEGALVNSVDQPEALEEAIETLKVQAGRFYKDYHAPTDRKVMTALINLLMEDVEESYLPFHIQDINTDFKGDVDKYVDHYFKHSMVVDPDEFYAFLEHPKLSVLRKDPAYVASIGAKKQLELRGQLRRLNQQAERGSRLYMKGLMEMNPDRVFYSDANSTLRLTYGTVGDYRPRDGVKYAHYTSVEGILEKEDPERPEFVVPAKLRQLIQEGDFGPYGDQGNLKVCLTTDNDITGGNSGSPLINARGELIGLAFDGNWEAMSGDIAFETELQKTISVDIRYVLFIIDKFAGAGHLIEEMTLQP